jgi:hypothetical protein
MLIDQNRRGLVGSYTIVLNKSVRSPLIDRSVNEGNGCIAIPVSSPSGAAETEGVRSALKTLGAQPAGICKGIQRGLRKECGDRQYQPRSVYSSVVLGILMSVPSWCPHLLQGRCSSVRKD